MRLLTWDNNSHAMTWGSSYSGMKLISVSIVNLGRTVTFDSNGGSPVAAQTVTYGDTVSKPTDPTKSGYTFTGWFSDAALNTEYDFAAHVTANITLYAKWKTPLPKPTVTSFTPTSGIVGSTVTITGTNFTGATEVRFNDVQAIAYTVVSPTKITVTVPSEATSGPISVVTPGGTGASPDKFTVISLKFTVSPPSVSLPPGGTGSVTVKTIAEGVINAVTLSVSNLPPGVTATFTPQTIPAPGSGQSILTFTAASSVVTGYYPVTVAATSGTVSAKTQIDMIITALPDIDASAILQLLID